MSQKEIESVYPKTMEDWRAWLSVNHEIKESVWLVGYNKKSNKESVSWSDSVDVALCYGWIDSKRQTIDEFSYRQFFCKRKANSTWSKINKDKVAQLIATGEMTPAGLACIERAKENGSWTILDEVEELIIPKDLETAFAKYPGAQSYFLSLSKSARKIILSWIVLAKRPETRQKRIDEAAEQAGKAILKSVPKSIIDKKFKK